MGGVTVSTMKTNVLHIIDSFDQGGTERQAIQLAHLLRDAGHYRIHLACLKKRGILLDAAVKLGSGEIVGFPLSSFFGKDFAAQLHRLKHPLRSRDIYPFTPTISTRTSSAWQVRCWRAFQPASPSSAKYRQLPRWKKSVVGIHMLNSDHDLTVIDCLMKRSK